MTPVAWALATGVLLGLALGLCAPLLFTWLAERGARRRRSIPATVIDLAAARAIRNTRGRR